MDYDGVLYRIMELYGCTQTPNEGVKWMTEKQFAEIARIEREHPWLAGRQITGVADPSIWDGSRGISTAEVAAQHGILFTPGVNDRIPGWMQCHYRLHFDGNGYPMMYVFSNCKGFIRTIPGLMYDEHKSEDLDTEGEDHCLVGSTMVRTDHGWERLEDMAGTTGNVYSSDGRLHRYERVRRTRRMADVFTVTMEDGTQFTGTSDHPIMMEDGTWATIGELRVGCHIKTAKC